MAEEKTQPKTENTEEKKIVAKPLPVTEGVRAPKRVDEAPVDRKSEGAADKSLRARGSSSKSESNIEPNSEAKTEKSEDKKDEKKESKQSSKKPELKKEKKYEAVAHGNNMHISKKQSMAICKFIKNKEIDTAIQELGRVALVKKAIPFKGEIPHRKGKMMSGRYPVKASKLFIPLLKGLKGNVIVNGMDLDKTRITIATASGAARPQRRGGVEAKRTNVILKAREISLPKRVDEAPVDRKSESKRRKS